SAAPRSAMARSSSSDSLFASCVVTVDLPSPDQACSSQVGLVGAHCPLCETLARVAVLDEIAHHPLDVVAEFGAGHLVLAQFAAETAVETEAATQMNLIA